MRKIVAYVAGPYRAETVNGIAENIQRVRSVALELWRMGYVVICPHLTVLMDGAVADEVFLEGGLELVRRSDVVVLVGDWRESEGTLAEVELALKLDMLVYVYADGGLMPLELRNEALKKDWEEWDAKQEN